MNLPARYTSSVRQCRAGRSCHCDGFTLLELIIVLVLVGVLAVTAASRFQGRGGFDSFSVQKQITAALRHMQLRAMQDTRVGFCHRILFFSSPAAVGPPNGDFSLGNQAATCGATIGNDAPEFLRIDNAVFSELGATLTALDGVTTISYIDFDSLGKPITSVGNCASDCSVTISTTSTSNICINSEGYIFDC